MPPFTSMASLVCLSALALLVGVARSIRPDGKPWSTMRTAPASTHSVGISAVRGADGKLTIHALGKEGASAGSIFSDGAHTQSNMGHLKVWTSPDDTDEEQLFAAGYVEGWATAEHIAQHFSNMWTFFNITSPEPLLWLSTQYQWLREQAAAEETQGQPFWVATRLLMRQFYGMLEGYNDGIEELNDDPDRASLPPLPSLTADQLYLLCSLGDMSDVRAAVAHQGWGAPGAAGGAGAAAQGPAAAKQEAAARFSRVSSGQRAEEGGAGAQAEAWEGHRGADGIGGDAGRPDWDKLGPHDVAAELAAGDRCSALVKVSPDFSQIWVGQAAWYSYAAMLRVFKHYDFALSKPGILGRSMGFSSYYGQLSSDDDFYLIGGTNLTVLQTTNRILEDALLDHIKPQSVLSWQRVRAACAVASDGPSWAQAVQTHNSGTYTNSWMVVDLSLFRPGKALAPGLLTVVEQVPGNVWWEDRTQQLESGYMALYNVPVLPQTYAALGYPEFVQRMAARGPAYEEAVSGALWQVAPGPRSSGVITLL